MSTRDYKKAYLLIENSKKIAVVSHINPEADAIGSSLALSCFLKKKGKKVHVINKTGVPETLRFLPGASSVDRALPEQVDLLIAVDTASLERTGFPIRERKNSFLILNIDHHITNDHFGDINLVDPDASSTSVIIFRFLRYLGVEFTEEIMVNLYAGIYEDTGGFAFSNTNEEVFTIARFMIKKGLDPSYVPRMLKEEVPLRKYLLLKEALSTLKVYPEIKTATMFVKKEIKKNLGTSWEDTDGFVDYAKSIKGVKVGILFNERENGTIKVSMRSKGDVDLSRIALEFGGGGHKNAAGFELKKEEAKNIKEYEKELFRKLKKVVG